MNEYYFAPIELLPPRSICNEVEHIFYSAPVCKRGFVCDNGSEQ